ncbi:high affinity immunoglobulin gamma Fc receptor I-like isoform X2 [Lithobates pipiens]
MPVFIFTILLWTNMGKSGTHWTYSWYKDKTLMEGGQQTLQITSSSVKDSGDYQCQIISSDIIDPITIYVLEGFEILQTPPSIFEGDLLTLRCHHSSEFILLNTTFYKDDTEIPSVFSDPNTEKTEYSELHIPEVDIKSVGGYNCNEVLMHGKDHYTFNLPDALKVIVKELFSPPEIKASYWVIEGGEMTVRCDTKLDPLRGGTELHFAFYRDERTVQDFSASDTYRVRSSQLEDSGNYTCEVRTASDTVRKRSDGFHIQIVKEFLLRILPAAIIGILLTLIISVVLIWKYRNKWRSCPCRCPKHSQSIIIKVTDTDPGPQDTCYTYLGISHLPQGNKVKKDELTVTNATLKYLDIYEQSLRPRTDEVDSGTFSS